MAEKQITITLTESDLSTVGQALAELPFRRVAGIIRTIQDQFDQQVPAEPAPAEQKAGKTADAYPYPTQRKVEV